MKSVEDYDSYFKLRSGNTKNNRQTRVKWLFPECGHNVTMLPSKS